MAEEREREEAFGAGEQERRHPVLSSVVDMQYLPGVRVREAERESRIIGS